MTATREQLLESIRKRKSRTGIVTADRYFREVEGCFNGGFCPVKHVGADSDSQWSKALKEAESKLTFSHNAMRVDQKSIKSSDNSEFIAEFDAIITTTRRDRDGDVLQTKGAELDGDGPLLWQHVAMAPIGRGIKVLKHTASVLKERLGVVDTALGLDAVKLIKARVLRISHGFEPKEFEPMDDEQGWEFSKFLIYERSVVSIPSNVDAVITSFTGKSFRSDLAKGWYDSVRQVSGKRRKSVATVPAEIDDEPSVLASVDEESGLWVMRTAAADTKGCTCSGEITIQHVDGEVEAKAVENLVWVDSEPEQPQQRSFADIEREYIAELATQNTDVLRKAHRRVSLMLRSSEEQEEAREWDELLSQLT
jgi:hypothetical protein